MKQTKRVRTGCLYLLKPVGWDRTTSRVMDWEDYIVRVIQPAGCPSNGTMGHCFVEARTGEFIGLILINSLQPLPKDVKASIRREQRKYGPYHPNKPEGGVRVTLSIAPRLNAMLHVTMQPIINSMGTDYA